MRAVGDKKTGTIRPDSTDPSALIFRAQRSPAIPPFSNEEIDQRSTFSVVLHPKLMTQDRLAERRDPALRLALGRVS